MTKRIVAWILGALFVSSAAIAAPAYDSPAWESYIEQGKGTLPSGTPTGPGAVAGIAKASDRKNLAFINHYFIDRPIDMSQVASIQLSDVARDAGMTYGTQTMRDFFDATAAKFKSLSGQSVPIPVAALLGDNPKEYEYPYPQSSLSKVTLGLIAIDAHKREFAVPNGIMLHGQMKDVPISNNLWSEWIKSLDEEMAKMRESWIQLSPEGRRQFAVSVIDDQNKARRDEMKKKRIARENAEEYDEEKYLDEMKYILAMPPEQQGEALEALHAKYNLQVKKSPKREKDSTKADSAKRVDLRLAKISAPAMWWLFEAILTQDGADVVSLTMSDDLYIQMIETAKSLKRPSTSIDLFRHSVTARRASRITVVLGCSARDRFLGCGEVSPKSDEIATRRSRQMLKDVANQDEETQIRALRMIALAHVPGLARDVEPFTDRSTSRDVASLAKRISMNRAGARQNDTLSKRQSANERKNALLERVRAVAPGDVENLCNKGKNDEYEACLNEEDFVPTKTPVSAENKKQCEERVNKRFGNCEDSAMPDLCRDVHKERLAECGKSTKERKQENSVAQRERTLKKADRCKRQSEQVYDACIKASMGGWGSDSKPMKREEKSAKSKKKRNER